MRSNKMQSKTAKQPIKKDNYVTITQREYTQLLKIKKQFNDQKNQYKNLNYELTMTNKKINKEKNNLKNKFTQQIYSFEKQMRQFRNDTLKEF